MKAISLWQPWASAVALGAKRIETRSWATKYRGPLAIHAAKRCVKQELRMYGMEAFWLAALDIRPTNPKHLWDILPFGAIIAVATLKDCVLININSLIADFGPITTVRRRDWYPIYTGWTEALLGNYTTNRFGWILENVEPLPKPVPFVGRQGLFEVPDYTTGQEKTGRI